MLPNSSIRRAISTSKKVVFDEVGRGVAASWRAEPALSNYCLGESAGTFVLTARPAAMKNAEARPADARDARPRSTASIFGYPIHPMLVPFPIVCFIGALITDIAYTQTANIMWANFSIWLITAGLVMGGFAALAGLVDYFGDRRVRAIRTATVHMLLNISVWVLELFNAFVHSRDGWTSVVPTGITLSAISVALLAVSGWLGGSLVYRHGVGTPR
jgi:uncharacterized membrane protein